MTVDEALAKSDLHSWEIHPNELKHVARTLAAEVRRLRAEDEAKFGCHVDFYRHGIPPYADCEIDKGTPKECTFAEELHAAGKGKASCQYWRKVEK